MKILIRSSVVLALVVVGLLGISSVVFADSPQIVDGFVCPVLGGQAGTQGNPMGHGPDGTNGISPIAGGYYTVGGPDVTVPDFATNIGWPGDTGSYLMPGDVGYTAIWNYANEP